MSYVTTTGYGTWGNHIDDVSAGLADDIRNALGDSVDDFDVEAIEDDWREAINAALPPNVTLTGDEFIGPAYDKDKEFDGYPVEGGEFSESLDIKAIVESVDLWVIVERHQWLTAEGIGRDLLGSTAKEPAKSASKALARLGVKPEKYLPKEGKGQPKSLYRAGVVKDALASRPGQGARTNS